MKPKDVFTPRASVVNEKMYVHRGVIEQALARALTDGRNILIHGESGCGKSWLFKKVFKEHSIPYLTVNMANANRLGSVNNALEDKFSKLKKSVVKSQSQGGSGGVELDLIVLKGSGGVEVIDHIEKLHAEPLDRCMELVSKNSSVGFIVIENLESALSNKKLIEEVTSIITLLDDEDYGEYNVKIMVIGTPSNIREYFSATPHSQTVLNRLIELPEVDRLSHDDADHLIRRGFSGYLTYSIKNDEIVKKDRFEGEIRVTKVDIVKEIIYHCDRIPQHLHALCLAVSYYADAEKCVDVQALYKGLRDWILDSFSGDYQIVESNMNSIETRTGRRNQVIYVLGDMRASEFRASDIERLLRSEFKKSTDGVKLNVHQILAELSNSTHPLLRRVEANGLYRFARPTFRVCVRALLRKNENDEVERIPFEDLSLAERT